MFFFLKSKTFTYFLLFVLVIAGLYSLFSITRESTPEIKVPIVSITTTLPGASAVDVEELVTDKIEKQLLRTLRNVDSISSVSNEGFSSIVVMFNTSVDISQGLQDVKDEIDFVKFELPDDAGDPKINEISFSEMPVFIFSIASRSAFTELSETIATIEDELLEINGVSSVDIAGLPEREINVILDTDKISSFGLNATDVLRGLSTANASLPLGSIIQDNIEYRITFKGDLNSAEDIRNTVIARTDAGNPIYIRDIGLVEDGLAKFSSVSRLSIQGSEPQQAVTFSVKKQVGADVTVMTEKIRKTLSELQENLNGEELQFVSLIDFGEIIDDDLRSLSFSALQTIILVFLVIFIGLGVRQSILAAIAIPLSFVIAFGGLYATGNTINFVSLFSLILVIGLLVDAAVVITEGLSNNLQKGNDPDTAARLTLKEFSSSVSAGTLTTIAVFVPLLFLSGITGQFIKSIPATIIIVLIGSLFVALAMIPVIGTKLLKPFRYRSKLSYTRKQYVDKIKAKYRRFLEYILESKKAGRLIITSIIALLIFSFSLIGFGLIKVEFFPPDDFKQFNVLADFPPGYTLSQTSEISKELEEKLVSIEHIDYFVTSVNAGSSDITVVLEDEKYGQEVLELVRETFDDYTKADILVVPPADGPSQGAPFEVKFIGEDLIELTQVANKAAQIVDTIPGAIDVGTSVDDNSIDIAFLVDREQVNEVGLTVIGLAQIVRTSLFGSDATSFKHPASDEDVDVIVKVGLNPLYTSTHDTNIISVDTLRSMPIQTPKGEVLLGSLMREDIVESTPSIRHEEGDRIVTVESYVAEGLVVNDILKEFLRRIETELEIPEGVEMKLGGDTEASGESTNELGIALLAGILLVIAVLVFQFNSIKKMLFIVSVIPFGLIGVLLGLFIFNQTLSFTSMLGFVALVGIVINNSIILIDVMGKLSERGFDKKNVVLEGAVSRLRPILMTTLTTVFGMLPLIFASSFWMPLTLSIISGLLFAVILTLIVIPLFYYWWGK